MSISCHVCWSKTSNADCITYTQKLMERELSSVYHTEHTQFLFSSPIFPELLQVRASTLGQSPKVNFLELLWQNFYRLDALPVAQQTASKHWRMTVFLTVDSTRPTYRQKRSETLWVMDTRAARLPVTITVFLSEWVEFNAPPDTQ